MRPHNSLYLPLSDLTPRCCAPSDRRCSGPAPWAGTLRPLSLQVGLGAWTIVDGDVLLPENVVRHVAGHDQVGKPKVQAVRHLIETHAPWTEVAEFIESPMTPRRIRELAFQADVVIDATGNDAFVPALAMVAESLGKPLVSGALYRGGAVARVQRQALPGDTAINLREDEERYPAIPAGNTPDDFATHPIGVLGSGQQRSARLGVGMRSVNLPSCG